MENLTTDDWDLIHDKVNEYYKEHSKLVNKMIKDMPQKCQDEFLTMANERNSVYGRDTKAE